MIQIFIIALLTRVGFLADRKAYILLAILGFWSGIRKDVTWKAGRDPGLPQLFYICTPNYRCGDYGVSVTMLRNIPVLRDARKGDILEIVMESQLPEEIFFFGGFEPRGTKLMIIVWVSRIRDNGKRKVYVSYKDLFYQFHDEFRHFKHKGMFSFVSVIHDWPRRIVCSGISCKMLKKGASYEDWRHVIRERRMLHLIGSRA